VNIVGLLGILSLQFQPKTPRFVWVHTTAYGHILAFHGTHVIYRCFKSFISCVALQQILKEYHIELLCSLFQDFFCWVNSDDSLRTMAL
jgi:hypothetical protein